MPIDLRSRIETALHSFSGGDLTASCIELLDALGYRSGRRLALSPNTAANFARTFAGTRGLNAEQARLEEWSEANFVMQLTDSEISQPEQMSLLREERAWNGGVYRSFALLAIGLHGENYTRTTLAAITRAVNRLFDMPAPIFFRYGDKLTLAIILRRPGQRDAQKDVLEKVTLIKDIDLRHPHAAHVRILEDLALENLRGQHSVTSFDELQSAWAQTLNITELNKRFYQEIANWYFWAIKQATFPHEAGDDAGVYNAISTIRLITRLIFVWFVKEKGLVPDELFQQPRVAELLRDFSPAQSSYYKSILQNLFFATLNTEMNTADKPDNRKFRSRNKSASGLDGHYGVHTLYRYEDSFRDPAAALQLFANIPFLNGGLFECLDKEVVSDGKRKMRLVDGFSDRAENPLAAPNFLFFAPEREVDLNADYGSSNKRYKVRGLIDTFQRYKFTVEENTPIEEEIALDPELLGKVFENLLAAYNPETGATARKQTGSFYTPREIVDYMVDEALIAYLETQLLASLSPRPTLTPGTPASQSTLFGEEAPVQSHLAIQDAAPDDAERAALVHRLRQLFAYNQQPHQFSQSETQQLIAAIDRLKLLDPACGSGAFPMGVLHKLVFVLGKLDRGNAGWRDLQRGRAIAETEAAYRIGDRAERKRRLDEIEEVFAGNSSDYGRKLYLIENCIYGVDIQPIAVQIAKLRFFISLVVDQNSDSSQPNRGIRPLPNLETKFVAANTLLGIERPPQMAFRNPQIESKEAELAEVRRRHFLARTLATKQKYRGEDERLRGEIADLLRGDGWSDAVASQLAHWNPYDQNAHADFFDPEWMFEIQEGFDIVLGNPPYVRQEQIKEYKIAFQRQYTCYTGTADLYVYFFERALQCLKSNGILTYISSNKYFRAGYGEKLRRLLATQTTLHQLIDFGDAPVFTAIAYPSIVVARKALPVANQTRVFNWQPGPPIEEFAPIFQERSIGMEQAQLTADGWKLEQPAVLRLLEKLRAAGKPLGEFVNGRFYRGILTGLNEAFVVDRVTRDRLIAEHPSSTEVLKPFLRGRDVKRWRIDSPDLWLLFIPWHFPLHSDASIKGASARAEQEFQKKYPAIYQHLSQYRTELSNRNKDETGVRYEWYALQRYGSEYWQEFNNTLIVWGNLATKPNFAFAGLGMHLCAPANLIVSDSKYLLGVLNSRMTQFLVSQSGAERQGGFLEYKPMYVSPLPIPPEPENDAIAVLADQILAAKAQDPAADVSALEAQIDRLVYALYGLTVEEIKIVEGG